MNRQLKQLFKTSLIALISTCGVSDAQAGILTFSLDYSGLAFGNSTVAKGIISIDDQLIPNPGSSFLDLSDNQIIKALTLTVSNATGGVGNGTFQMTDFDFATWDTAGDTLDFTKQLLGQWTQGGGWGTATRWDGSAGEFNLYAKTGSNAPTSSGYFTLATNNDFINGDLLKLVSFKPIAGSVQPVPLPAPLWLFGSAIGMFLTRRTCKKGN
ncbi:MULTISPECIES: hypothetical protein [Methylomonas]|uniref:PEP-CTERM protein-sorting domain-containing protein n=2 Tax=Methylomonas TaxID=416 RepID=A0A140E3F0_9GAMM|nr:MULTISPECIES: hypothetical protein [Methylomonas]AMK74924.1 hypothetical protein JT25_000225 [Methylomonas denitrificans]OAI05788.1 hypothetical protein A1342_03260 [Methylomonas methanica]TCV81005.1 hypothetical protein EDE11_11754 [Methylomonas methanica]